MILRKIHYGFLFLLMFDLKFFKLGRFGVYGIWPCEETNACIITPYGFQKLGLLQ